LKKKAKRKRKGSESGLLTKAKPIAAIARIEQRPAYKNNNKRRPTLELGSNWSWFGHRAHH